MAKNKESDKPVDEAYEMVKQILGKSSDKRICIKDFDDVDYYKNDFALDTGNKALNYLCSGDPNIGLPSGQMISLEGQSFTGKSLTALQLIAGGVRSGALVMVADIERTYNKAAFEQYNINSRDVKMLEGLQQLEDCFQKLYDILLQVPEKHPNRKILVVIDSLSALVTKHLQETGMDKVDMQAAKQVSTGLKMINSAMSRNPNIFFVMVNQTYNTLNTSKYATEEQKFKAKGGGAVEFYPGTRIRYSVAKRIYQSHLEGKTAKEGPVIGSWIRLESIKNRFNNPYIKAELMTIYNRGYDPYSGLFTLAENMKILEQTSSGWWNFVNNPLESSFRKKDFEKLCKQDSSYLERFVSKTEDDKKAFKEEVNKIDMLDVEIPDDFDDEEEIVDEKNDFDMMVELKKEADI
jgi:RecA/RadA recombinase